MTRFEVSTPVSRPLSATVPDSTSRFSVNSRRERRKSKDVLERILKSSPKFHHRPEGSFFLSLPPQRRKTHDFVTLFFLPAVPDLQFNSMKISRAGKKRKREGLAGWTFIEPLAPGGDRWYTYFNMSGEGHRIREQGCKFYRLPSSPHPFNVVKLFGKKKTNWVRSHARIITLLYPPDGNHGNQLKVLKVSNIGS